MKFRRNHHRCRFGLRWLPDRNTRLTILIPGSASAHIQSGRIRITNGFFAICVGERIHASSQTGNFGKSVPSNDRIETLLRVDSAEVYAANICPSSTDVSTVSVVTRVERSAARIMPGSGPAESGRMVVLMEKSTIRRVCSRSQKNRSIPVDFF